MRIDQKRFSRLSNERLRFHVSSRNLFLKSILLYSPTVMVHKTAQNLLHWLAILLLAGCSPASSEVSEKITQQFQSSGRTFVNLDEVVPGNWDKVCILGPYSDSKAAKTTLGFEWEIESKSSIATNDGIAQLLFVQENRVVVSTEHPRHDGDFTNLSRQCFPREQSTFVHKTNPTKG